VTTELIRYDAMCRAIAEALEVDEVKEIRNRAIALEIYARQAINFEAETQAARIRVRAERRCGQLLRETRERGERHRGHGDQKSESHDVTPKLADLGITRNQSSQWQRLADLPEAEFESLLSVGRPTTAGMLRETLEEMAKEWPTDPDAMWVWGRLNDFAQHRAWQREPQELIAGMDLRMIEDVALLAPRMAQWLQQLGEEACRGKKRPG
jgi:hypothetical protein